MANYYEAYDDGHRDGAREGFKSGAAEGYTKGHAEGAASGYAKGYEEGYEAGGGGSSSEWKYKTRTVIGYGGAQVSSFDATVTSVLYAPNAEGDTGVARFREMIFGGPDVILDFPKVSSINSRCFSGMLGNSGQDPCIVSSGNFPEVLSIGADAFGDNQAVTADFPKCTSVSIGAFEELKDEESTDRSSLSFAAMTPIWACFPAISGAGYHHGPAKLPIIPVCVENFSGLPDYARRRTDIGACEWGTAHAAGYVDTPITWSGNAPEGGFWLSKADVSAGVGDQRGPFGHVLYEEEGDRKQRITWGAPCDISLPSVPLEAVTNTIGFQDAYVNSQMSSGSESSMGVLGLVGGSTITCSDGVYTVE